MTEQRENAHVAATLDEYAAVLELAGAGAWSARAFRRAAALIRELPTPVVDLVRAGRVRELRGIGPGIEARLIELVETGRIAELEELKESTAPELVALGRMLGFGPRTATAIGDTLGVRTAGELEEAARAGRLREVPGIGPRTEARILAALQAAPAAHRNALTLERARLQTDEIADALDGQPAGAARRWVDSVDRLVVVVPTTNPDDVRTRFAALPQIVTMLSPDEGLTRDGIPVDLVLAPPEQLGTALVRATGSASYVAPLEPLPQAPDEAGVFRLLELEPVPPELREPAAPALAEQLLGHDDSRGDLHCHTSWSDGRATVLAMGEAARDRGYAYLAICDHTTAVRVVPGLDADAVRRQAAEIADANERLAPFRVLRGIECDIRPDGSLDLPDDVLAELDWVQISLHAGQRAPRRELTARVIEAMHHPSADCLSHPTGRLIGHRPENALDLERTIEASLRTAVALEINGLPDRLDLSAENARIAIEAGVKLVCSTDAHSVAGLDRMPLSVHTARRAGAGTTAVLNTLPLDRLLRRSGV